MTTRAQVIPESQERAFWIAGALVLLLALTYGALVRTTIMTAVERQNLEEKATALNAHVAELESEYLAITNTSVTLEKAEQTGLLPIEAKRISYIVRTTGENVAFNSNSVR